MLEMKIESLEIKKKVSRNMKRNVQEQFRVILGNKANESLEMILPRFSGEGNKCMTSKQEEIHYVIREEKQTQELPV